MPSFKFTPTPASEAGFSAAALGELDAYLDAKVVNGDQPGFILLLARGDQLVRGHVTGFSDWRSKTPLNPDAIFTLYSMSKPFAAVAMLLLYEEGRWQLDDPVSLHLPEFAEIAALPGSKAGREPTIRETFTHTAGWSLGKTVEEMRATLGRLNPGSALSLADLMARYAQEPLGYEPGKSWEYSVATDLQAAIVERLSGERYDLFLKRRLFDPLDMQDTGFVLDEDQQRRLARGHILDPETGRLRAARPDEMLDSIFPMGGTSLKSSAIDYARFARMLLNRGKLGDVEILKPETIDLMLQNHLPDELLEARHSIMQYVVGEGNGHALNGLVCLDPVRSGRPVGKGTYEWGGAFGCWFWIDPENDILCIGMNNRQRIFTDARPTEVVAQELVYRALREA